MSTGTLALQRSSQYLKEVVICRKWWSEVYIEGDATHTMVKDLSEMRRLIRRLLVITWKMIWSQGMLLCGDPHDFACSLTAFSWKFVLNFVLMGLAFVGFYPVQNTDIYFLF
ncbi:hypothetical protein MtrunA17_Chr7g0245451 [Medicago truncatula]|uniref:Transmembrane protein, putative n=1 Tax=Medicago truncatula TaxID=3880 RepID=G7KZ78_MEDTR|nr:transmembrane protein, putative [Medicago truncatula]RHN46740.1 hypothetical protein MtrunA17_Chr7g0245451 [Medicago truncatula]